MVPVAPMPKTITAMSEARLLGVAASVLNRRNAMPRYQPRIDHGNKLVATHEPRVKVAPNLGRPGDSTRRTIVLPNLTLVG
jgi:hypothetical protein